MSRFASAILFRRFAGPQLLALVLSTVLVVGFASASLAGPISSMNVQTYIPGTAIQGAEGQVNDRGSLFHGSLSRRFDVVRRVLDRQLERPDHCLFDRELRGCR